jgi:hypothetical protein
VDDVSGRDPDLHRAGHRRGRAAVLIESDFGRSGLDLSSVPTRFSGVMQLLSTLVCPSCQHSTTEAMPTDACQFFYDCKGCGQRLKPKPGDCCVFCSYGSVPCPPVQQNGKCC